jgi:hypothetical protein
VSTDTLDRDFPETTDRLRRTLAAVAGSTPTPDRSAELAARLAAGGHRDGVADFGVAAAARRRRRRLLVVAAAAVAVLAIGAAMAARAGRDEPGAFTTNPDVGTGWFLPPEGWTVTGVDSDFLDVGENGACPCTNWVAARPGDGPAGATIVLSESAAAPEPDTEGEPIDVGGRQGRITEVDPIVFMTASGGGRRVVVRGRNVERADLVAVADAALDQRESGSDLVVDRLPLPAGFVGTAPIVKPAWRSENLVAVHVTEDGTGRRLTYQIVPAGYLRDDLLNAQTVTVADGSVAGSGTDPDSGTPMLVLAGGPEDIQVGGTAFGEEVDRLTAAELRQFAAGLREVETADWRAALDRATGPVKDEVRQAETLTSPPLVER